MKNIVFFTGAGVSKESGINTFRDYNGIWNRFDPEEVATLDTWRKDREKVLEFYNKRRRDLSEVSPNLAHTSIADMSSDFNVCVITQNVDNLHERAGSGNVIHLHGELLKADSSNNPMLTIPWFSDITLNDKHPVDKSQLRPHIVWFGERPLKVPVARVMIEHADYLIIVGTSLSISYTIPLLMKAKKETPIIYIDPNPSEELTERGKFIIYLRESACIGVPEIINQIKNKSL